MLSRVSYRARWVATLVLVTGFLIFFVFPTRSLLAQRSELRDSRRELEVLEQNNERLDYVLQKLGTDDEVRRLAHSYGFIEPGERPIIPVAPPEDDPDGTGTTGTTDAADAAGTTNATDATGTTGDSGTTTP